MSDPTTMIETTPSGASPVRDPSTTRIVFPVLIIYVLVAFFGIWTAAA